MNTNTKHKICWCFFILATIGKFLYVPRSPLFCKHCRCGYYQWYSWM